MFTSPITSVLAAASTGRDFRGSDDPPAEPPKAAPAPAPAEAAPAAPAVQPSQLKLVVAKSEASLAYTYTLVDQVTGRVVAEIPHQAAQEAAARPNYAAGGVVDTHV